MDQSKDFLYSVPVTEKKEGQSPIYRHPESKEALFLIPQNLKSLANVWDDIISRNGERVAIEQTTYNQLDRTVRKVGTWLSQQNHHIIYLYSKNCFGWQATDLACWNYGQINVPLYDTLGKESFNYIINLSQGSVIFTIGPLVKKILTHFESEKFNIRQLVIFDEISGDDREKIENLGIKVTLFSDILKIEDIIDRPLLNHENHLTYIFTSGTTGIPKGVVYTHKMVISEFASNADGSSLPFSYTPSEAHLSYLPIPHAYERLLDWFLLYFGAKIQFIQLPITEIVKEMMRVKPTFFATVPRLLNRFYSMLKGLYEKEGNKQKIKAMFGGRIKFIISASAPVSHEILSFYREVLECEIIQVYGQTETLGATYLTNGKHVNPHHVGGPIKSVQMKLVDIPEMDYYTHNNPPRGEVCSRGDPIFKEYFKRPDATKETIDEEGWNHSGDVGQLCPDGAIRIIDRKKNIYKLSQGEYVAPEKVENIYARVGLVAEVFVYGDSTKDYSIGFVHPNLAALPTITKSLGIEETDPKILCENEKIREIIFNEMKEQGQKDGLFGFEQVRKISLTWRPFAEIGILTDTMKLQRNKAKSILKDEIEKLYSSE